MNHDHCGPPPWTHTGHDVGARPYPIPAPSNKVITSLAIPLPDGLELFADLYVPGTQSEAAYTFDPDDPTPYAHAELDGERIPLYSATQHREREDILLYTTAPITEPLALVGDPSLLLYAAADCPDFDLCARLFDLYPEGRAIFLTDGVIRARFRKGWEHPELVPQNSIQEYRIDLWHLGHLVRPGHALRLEIASGAFQRFDVNPCTGRDLATETVARPARITLFHGPDHPAHLALTVARDPRLQGERDSSAGSTLSGPAGRNAAFSAASTSAVSSPRPQTSSCPSSSSTSTSPWSDRSGPWCRCWWKG